MLYGDDDTVSGAQRTKRCLAGHGVFVVCVLRAATTLQHAGNCTVNE